MMQSTGNGSVLGGPLAATMTGMEAGPSYLEVSPASKQATMWGSADARLVVSAMPAAGNLHHLSLKAKVDLPPDEAWEMLADPAVKPWKHVKDIPFREVLEDDGQGVQKIELEQVAGWAGFNVIRTRMLCTKDDNARTIDFHLAKKGIMTKFDGQWRVQPLVLEGQEGNDPQASVISLEQDLCPAISPPGPLKGFMKGMILGEMKAMATDMVAESRRIRRRLQGLGEEISDDASVSASEDDSTVQLAPQAHSGWRVAAFAATTFVGFAASPIPGHLAVAAWHAINLLASSGVLDRLTPDVSAARRSSLRSSFSAEEETCSARKRLESHPIDVDFAGHHGLPPHCTDASAPCKLQAVAVHGARLSTVSKLKSTSVSYQTGFPVLICVTELLGALMMLMCLLVVWRTNLLLL